jgi:hypothetical protein
MARLSRRTGWDRSVNRLARIAAERRRAGKPILDLTETNPTRVGLPPPADVLSSLAAPEGLVYEPLPFGWGPARRAVAEGYAACGAHVDAEDVVLTPSTSEAYSWLFKLLCDPGDDVLVPRPSYPLFDYLAELESVRVERYELGFDGAWHLDVAAVASAVSPRTRAVVVVSPNNPTGSYLDRRERDALVGLCADRGLALICDEVFAGFDLDAPDDAVFTVAGAREVLCAALGGLSKSCGLPQLKLGWIAVSGPPGEREEALARLEIVADTYLAVGTPVQLAAPSLLRRRAELAAPIRRRIRECLEVARGVISPDLPADVLPVEGGWSAVVRVPDTLGEEERAAALLESAGVLVHPGYFFDFPRGAHLVVSLLTPPDVLRSGLLEIARRL